MNKTKIEWTDYTWNPITGCKHNCFYCYAKKIAMRFDRHFNPTFHKDRLKEPYKLKKPSKIFVGSMSDVFGDWIDARWIRKIIKVARENPQHTFQFLTKNPKRYTGFLFPDNCWLGVTIESKEQKNRINFFTGIKNYQFASIEPLLGDFIGVDLKRFGLVIVGAMTGQGAIKPKKEWIDSIKHPNIFYKNNIKKFLKKV